MSNLILNNVAFDISDFLVGDEVLEEIYVDRIIYSGIAFNTITDKVGLDVKFSIYDINKALHTLSFMYISNVSDTEDLMSIFAKADITGNILLGDIDSITSCCPFIISDNKETNKEYPIFVYARDSERCVKVYLKEKDSFLIKYIETKILNMICPLSMHNLAIIGLPEKVKNTDILYVEGNLNIKCMSYSYDKKNKLEHCAVIINIKDVDEDLCFKFVFEGAKKRRIITGSYDTLEDMIKAKYPNEDDLANLYAVDADHQFNLSYTKELGGANIEKKILVYYETDNDEYTRTFTFYRHGYELLIKDILEEMERLVK